MLHLSKTRALLPRGAHLPESSPGLWQRCVAVTTSLASGNLDSVTHSFTRVDEDARQERRPRPVDELMQMRAKHFTATEMQGFRSSSASLPDLCGMRFVGRVSAVDAKRVQIDTGLPHSPHQYRRRDITLNMVVRCEAGQRERSGDDDVRVGDEVLLTLTHRTTPIKEPWLQPLRHAHASFIEEAVLQEVRDAFKDGRTVPGRLLNPCRGGFTVGIAGLVGFAPSAWVQSPPSALGQLLNFEVHSMQGSTAQDLQLVLQEKTDA